MKVQMTVSTVEYGKIVGGAEEVSEETLAKIDDHLLKLENISTLKVVDGHTAHYIPAGILMTSIITVEEIVDA